MHGHGDKPYTCTYEGCSRALPKNGFSRNWNLRDHMRRIHTDHGASINSHFGSSSSVRGSTSDPVKSRKMDYSRSSRPLSHSRKLRLWPEPTDDALEATRIAKQGLSDRWYEHRSAMQQCLQHYDSPANFDSWKQLSEARAYFAAMAKITRKLKKTKDSLPRSHKT